MKERNKIYWEKNKKRWSIIRKEKRKLLTPGEKKKLNQKVTEWRKNNIVKSNLSANNRYHKIRIECLNYYSNNNPKCACCGESEIKFLCLDHINNDGNKHRKEVKQSNIYGYIRAKKRFPSGLQVLCHNCNMSKAFSGSCPHKD